MPEGASVAVEAILPDSVDESRRSIMLRGAAAMGDAKYKLASHSDNTFTFTRRYLPGVPRNICVVVLILAVVVQSSSGGEPSPALAAGWVAIFAMIFYRRTEMLTVDIRPAAEGTRVIAAGSASKKGRAALEGIMAGAGESAPA